jgi:ribosomal protein L11 methyltransferase
LRASVVVPGELVEEATAAMLELFPEGFAELAGPEATELVAFTDRAGAERLRARFGDARVEPVPDGWESEWMRFHSPVEVGSLWIGPPWERPTPGLVPVVIDPGLAFGTGAHPTTQLCLELIQSLERTSLLDVGSGSGVLAIAACKLGYAPVTAVDIDEAAVEATKRNGEANGVVVDARLLDAGSDALPDAEIAVANIDLRTISRLEPSARCRVLVTSGYYVRDRPAVAGFGHVERRVQEEWAADLFGRE